MFIYLGCKLVYYSNEATANTVITVSCHWVSVRYETKMFFFYTCESEPGLVDCEQS